MTSVAWARFTGEKSLQSVIRSTTLSGFRIDSSIDLSSVVTGFSWFEVLDEESTDINLPTPTNAVQTQTHSGQYLATKCDCEKARTYSYCTRNTTNVSPVCHINSTSTTPTTLQSAGVRNKGTINMWAVACTISLQQYIVHANFGILKLSTHTRCHENMPAYRQHCPQPATARVGSASGRRLVKMRGRGAVGSRAVRREDGGALNERAAGWNAHRRCSKEKKCSAAYM